MRARVPCLTAARYLLTDSDASDGSKIRDDGRSAGMHPTCVHLQRTVRDSKRRFLNATRKLRSAESGTQSLLDRNNHPRRNTG